MKKNKFNFLYFVLVFVLLFSNFNSVFYAETEQPNGGVIWANGGDLKTNPFAYSPIVYDIGTDSAEFTTYYASGQNVMVYAAGDNKLLNNGNFIWANNTEGNSSWYSALYYGFEPRLIAPDEYEYKLITRIANDSTADYFDLINYENIFYTDMNSDDASSFIGTDLNNNDSYYSYYGNYVYKWDNVGKTSRIAVDTDNNVFTFSPTATTGYYFDVLEYVDTGDPFSNWYRVYFYNINSNITYNYTQIQSLIRQKLQKQNSNYQIDDYLIIGAGSFDFNGYVNLVDYKSPYMIDSITKINNWAYLKFTYDNYIVSSVTGFDDNFVGVEGVNAYMTPTEIEEGKPVNPDDDTLLDLIGGGANIFEVFSYMYNTITSTLDDISGLYTWFINIFAFCVPRPIADLIGAMICGIFITIVLKLIINLFK